MDSGSPNPLHRVVVIGGGFAGLSAVRALRSAPVEITLIDRRNFHLFQPLLYQVATGSLSPGDISSPLRSVFSHQRNVRVLMGAAASINPQRRLVMLSDGANVEYDSLIVATGSGTSYFGHDEWREHAQCLKSIEDATEMRRRIFTAFENAESETASGVSPWLTFVIVGGGATGVELAGALSEIAHKTLKDDFRRIRPEQAQLILVDQGPRILSAFSDRIAHKAAQALSKLGVQVRCGVRVNSIDADGVDLRDADENTSRIASKTVLWAGGVAVVPIVRQLVAALAAPTDPEGRFLTDPKGRILVNPDLTIPDHPEIFVTGDVAALKHVDGSWLPGVAQVALQQGKYAGGVIHRRRTGQAPAGPFVYSDLGDMAVIGRASAVAKLFGVEVWGWPAWIVWLFIHLMNLVEFQSRVVVLIRWAFQYLTFSRGARLITGEDGSKGNSA
ncbi:MAG: NAD(P)/FAD-dependent oxidoreductase [Acidobacteriota bacterium]